MRIERTLVAAASSAAISIFGGCSAATTPSANPIFARPPAVAQTRPAATQTLIYTCEFTANTCVWYVHGVNRVAGSITGLSLPNGVGVDSAGNVYIANFGAQNVPVYAKGSTTLVRTLDDSGHFPIDVKVDSDGTVYVANNQDANSASGSVSVYAPGSTTISRVIKDPTFGNPTGIAVDEHHELIVCFDDNAPGGDCDEFVHGRGPGLIEISDFPASMEGVAFDNAGNIAVQNANYGTFYFQPNFSMCSADQTNGSEMYLAFDRSNGDIYKTNAGGFIEENAYSPCNGGTPERKYDAGLNGNVPYGVAVDPGSGP